MRRTLLAIATALVATSASAVSTTPTPLTTSWQDLGAGPIQVQTSGPAFLSLSDTAPAATAGGFKFDSGQQPFAFCGTTHVYARVSTAASKVVAQAAPATCATGGGGGGGGGTAADQTATNATDAQATTTNNQHGLAFPYIFNGTTWDRWRGTGGAANVSVTNFPTTQAVTWTGQTVAATQSGAWNTNLYVGGAANASGNPAFVQVTNFPTTQAINATQWGGATLGAATAWGTAPTGNVPGVNANVLTLPAVAQGAPAVVGNAWPFYLAQGGAALSQTNPLPSLPVPSSYQLLNNANATGPSFSAAGGNYLLALSGTFNGATVTINATVNGVTTALASYTAAPSSPPQFTIASGTSVQAVVSGGAPSGLYATLGGIGPGGSASPATTTVTPTPLATTANKLTINTTNTYQSALSASATRKGCTIQYRGANTGYVFFGSAAPADTTTSIVLAQYQTVSCQVGGNGVDTDAIFATATAGDTFVVNNQ